MTAGVSRTAGAAFQVEVDWHAMDWHQAHRTVNRLQARIVKAMQEETLRNRVPQRAFERLELHDGKLSRAVLRGRGGVAAALLPGGRASNCPPYRDGRIRPPPLHAMLI